MKTSDRTYLRKQGCSEEIIEFVEALLSETYEDAFNDGYTEGYTEGYDSGLDSGLEGER